MLSAGLTVRPSPLLFRFNSCDFEGGVGGSSRKNANIRAVEAVTRKASKSSKGHISIVSASSSANVVGKILPSAMPTMFDAVKIVVAMSRCSTENQTAPKRAGRFVINGWATAPKNCPNIKMPKAPS